MQRTNRGEGSMSPHSKRFAAVNYHAYLRGIIPGTAAMGSLDLVSKSDIKIQEQSYPSGKFGHSW